jgi:hypothetical protein
MTRRCLVGCFCVYRYKVIFTLHLNTVAGEKQKTYFRAFEAFFEGRERILHFLDFAVRHHACSKAEASESFG